MYVYVELSIKNQQRQLLQSPCSWCRGVVEKDRFQQSASTRSGAGEKETLNINVGGKTTRVAYPSIRRMGIQELLLT